MIYALDTNTISYYLQGNQKIKLILEQSLIKGHQIVIPPIVYYEVRRGFKRVSSPKKEKIFAGLCSIFNVGEINISILEIAADIYADSRNTGKIIHDADILIAAFCLVNDYILVTNNTKDFESIQGLNIADWTV